MPKAAIFDLDGTLLDSVDLHAIAWQEALEKFGHDVSFEQTRGQIGKGGDKLIPLSSRPTNSGITARKWRSGAASALRRRICRWCVRSPQFPICFDACGMPASESPSRPRPRKMNSTNTSTSRASPTWSN